MDHLDFERVWLGADERHHAPELRQVDIPCVVLVQRVKHASKPESMGGGKEIKVLCIYFQRKR
jgi:hypothetical protein